MQSRYELHRQPPALNLEDLVCLQTHFCHGQQTRFCHGQHRPQGVVISLKGPLYTWSVFRHISVSANTATVCEHPFKGALLTQLVRVGVVTNTAHSLWPYFLKGHSPLDLHLDALLLQPRPPTVCGHLFKGALSAWSVSRRINCYHGQHRPQSLDISLKGHFPLRLPHRSIVITANTAHILCPSGGGDSSVIRAPDS